MTSMVRMKRYILSRGRDPLAGIAKVRHARAPRFPHAGTLLTTQAAAELMQCSLPYIAMLIDNKKLAGALLAQDGHCRVPASSVRAWINERDAKEAQSDYRAAAAEAGMYAIPEEAFVDILTRRRI